MELVCVSPILTLFLRNNYNEYQSLYRRRKMPDFTKEYFRYLPVSAREKQWGLYVTGGGFNSIAPGEPYPRPGHPRMYAFHWSCGRRLPEYQVLYITRGRGEFESERSGRQSVAAGCAVLLFAGVWHRYRPLMDFGWDEYWVSFDGDYVQRLIDNGFLKPEEPVLKTGLDDAVLRAYLSLMERMRVEPAGFPQLIAADTMEILATVLGAVRNQQLGSRRNALIRQAKSLLEADAAGTLTIDRLAARLAVSVTHFYRLFKEHTGMSPYQYRLQLSVHRAKAMLHGTNLSVKEIAKKLHYESEFHFSKIFKKKTAFSPRQWRELSFLPEIETRPPPADAALSRQRIAKRPH
jgi:AraC-like DNA-binding protein